MFEAQARGFSHMKAFEPKRTGTPPPAKFGSPAPEALQPGAKEWRDSSDGSETSGSEPGSSGSETSMVKAKGRLKAESQSQAGSGGGGVFSRMGEGLRGMMFDVTGRRTDPVQQLDGSGDSHA